MLAEKCRPEFNRSPIEESLLSLEENTVHRTTSFGPKRSRPGDLFYWNSSISESEEIPSFFLIFL